MSSEVPMRISELSSRTDVPVATIKFYLRERLLHEGVHTSATQAQYDESHVARLRLIRALLGPGGLSIAAARRVVQAIDEPPESLHDLLGVAATSVLRTGGASGEELRVHELMRRWGWQIDRRDHPFHVALEDSLRALDEAGFELSEGALDFYVEHMHQIAQYEIDSVPTDSPTAAVRYVVLGTVLIEPLILALRRLAQAEASARRFG
jgi:DNA-binding transcriptional MerR regulator